MHKLKAVKKKIALKISFSHRPQRTKVKEERKDDSKQDIYCSKKQNIGTSGYRHM